MRHKFLLLVVLSFPIFFNSNAQQNAIQGLVYDLGSHKPIDFISVYAQQDSVNKGFQNTLEDGSFVIKPLKVGTYDVVIRKVGYNKFIKKGIVVSSNKATTLDTIFLTKNTLLKTVVIKDYMPIIDPGKTSCGRAISSSEIRKAPVRDINSLVRAGGGVYQKDKGQLQIGGSRSYGTRIIVDGQPLRARANIPTDAKNSTEISTGGLPAKYANPTEGLLYRIFRRKIEIVEPPVYPAEQNDYGKFIENKFEWVAKLPLSTFSIDVDHASYSMIRRQIFSGYLPETNAVRIEELINYFPYNYAAPKSDTAVNLIGSIGDCPWNASHKLAHIALKAKDINSEKRSASNLVFLVDVSGSMSSEDRLPLVQKSLVMLVHQLKEDDKISLVVYAGNAGVVLESTPCSEKNKIINAINQLQSGGSTAGGEGIALAYKIAKQNLITDGNNRVIIATDGDFNVGITDQSELIGLIEDYKKQHIFLSVLGYGMGNYKDTRMEYLADKGNGNYAYIDDIKEAEKVLVTEMGSTIYTVAKDVKLQIEFNPKFIASYRLIGYENRKLEDKDFNNDAKDAGEMGSGCSVTALYELVPVNNSTIDSSSIPLKYQQQNLTSAAINSSEWISIKLRYKEPKSNVSKLLLKSISAESKNVMDDNFNFISAVAEAGLVLRNSEFKGTASIQHALETVEKSKYSTQYKNDFSDLLLKINSLAIAKH